MDEPYEGAPRDVPPHGHDLHRRGIDHLEHEHDGWPFHKHHALAPTMASSLEFVDRDVVATVLQRMPQDEMETAYLGLAADQLAPLFREELRRMGYKIEKL